MRTRTRTSTTIREDRHTLRGFCVRLGTILIAGVIASGAGAQSRWVTWGGSFQLPPPPAGTEYLQFDIHNHIVAVLSDGTIQAWGDNSSGQCDVPTPPPGTHYVEVRAGNSFTVARLSDGNVLAWGYNAQGECDVPPLPPGLSYVQIDTGDGATIARRSDGSVIIWGDCFYGSCGEYQPPPGMAFVDVDADSCYFARLSDGSVVQFGQFGGCSAGNPPPLPPGVFYVEITSSCAGHALARRSDGSVVAWGLNDSGQCNVPALPPGLTYTRIVSGLDLTFAWRSDGSVVAWGRNDGGQANLPALPTGLRYIDVAGQTVALFSGCSTCESPFCFGDGGGSSVPCPCGNDGQVGGGCDNSHATGGAMLSVRGRTSPDRVVLEVTGEVPSALSVFLQGRQVLENSVLFGDGARCIGGTLKRIGVKGAVGGEASYPAVGDPQISVRSAVLGDPIAPGSYRYYQVCYRDPNPGFCSPILSTFNASNAVMVRW